MNPTEIFTAFVTLIRLQNSALRIGDAHGLTDTDEMYIGILASALRPFQKEETSLPLQYEETEMMFIGGGANVPVRG